MISVSHPGDSTAAFVIHVERTPVGPLIDMLEDFRRQDAAAEVAGIPCDLAVYLPTLSAEAVDSALAGMSTWQLHRLADAVAERMAERAAACVECEPEVDPTGPMWPLDVDPFWPTPSPTTVVDPEFAQRDPSSAAAWGVTKPHGRHEAPDAGVDPTPAPSVPDAVGADTAGDPPIVADQGDDEPEYEDDDVDLTPTVVDNVTTALAHGTVAESDSSGAAARTGPGDGVSSGPGASDGKDQPPPVQRAATKPPPFQTRDLSPDARRAIVRAATRDGVGVTARAYGMSANTLRRLIHDERVGKAEPVPKRIAARANADSEAELTRGRNSVSFRVCPMCDPRQSFESEPRLAAHLQTAHDDRVAGARYVCACGACFPRPMGHTAHKGRQAKANQRWHALISQPAPTFVRSPAAPVEPHPVDVSSARYRAYEDPSEFRR